MKIIYIIIGIIVIITIYYLNKTCDKIKGGKFKYKSIKPKKYNDDVYIMPRIELLNLNDDFMYMDNNTNPDMFWKLIMFKLMNNYLDSNYNFLMEDELDIKRINKDINKSEINYDNYENDILSKIPKSPLKTCNLEYNENYFNEHYKKCINTDMINIIRLYTNVDKNNLTTDEMKEILISKLKFTHFHINYGNGFKFVDLYEFNNLDTYLKEYLKNIDILSNSIIMVNIYKFNFEYNYFIIEYKPDFEIKTLYDYFCFVTESHNQNSLLNYNFNINNLKQTILDIDNLKQIYKYGYSIKLNYPYCYISKNNKVLKMNLNEMSLTLRFSSKKTYTDDCEMIKLLYASGLKQYIKPFFKIFLEINLNDKNYITIKSNISSLSGIVLKNKDNNWLVPNPDNIIFK